MQEDLEISLMHYSLKEKLLKACAGPQGAKTLECSFFFKAGIYEAL